MLLHLGIQFNLFVLSPSTFIAVCVFHMQRESEPSTKEMRTKSSTQSDLKKKNHQKSILNMPFSIQDSEFLCSEFLTGRQIRAVY